MRYMGQLPALPGLENVGFGLGPLDPQKKAELMAAARNLDDGRATDLVDIANETHVGKRRVMQQIAIGAGGGLLVGLVLAKAIFR